MAIRSWRIGQGSLWLCQQTYVAEIVSFRIIPMCVLCAALNPAQADAEWQSHATATQTQPLAAANRSDAQAIADYLVRGYWEEAYPFSPEYDDPRKFDVQAGGTLTYSFKGMSDAEKTIARAALDAWTEVSGLKFRQVNNGGDIRFRNDDPDGGAYSYSELGALQNGFRNIEYSVINIEPNWDARPISTNSYWFQTYVHEIGHALGLGHAGQYNGEGTIDREFKYDSWQLSIMSYVAQDENSNIRGEYAFLGSLMAADILAIQDIYGSNVRANHGNSVYGFNSNIGGPLGRMMQAWLDNAPFGKDVWQDNPMAFTVYDTGGRDVINVSGAWSGQRINLGEGKVSDFMGVRGGMVIAYDSVIENARGSRWNDIFTGNSANNRLEGGAGNDRLLGRAGIDNLKGDAGHDRLLGGDRNDLLTGGAGDDVLNGGAQTDTAIFTTRNAIRVSLLVTGEQQTGEGRDRLISIENLTTGAGNDRLIGSDTANVLSAGLGHDQLFGKGGADRLVGADGQDRLFGGAGHDTLLGGQGRNMLRGEGGDDQIIGGGSNDLLVGGGGADRLSGAGGADALKGEQGNDTLLGGAGADSLAGGSEDDLLTGGAGADVFRFGQGADRITDFQDDVDTLEITVLLWGGGKRTVAEVLAFATVQAEGVVFDFGNGNALTLAGLTAVDQLQNDLRIIL
jgi:serralysin